MTPANPLLPAVLAGPEDDTPRLIYADWQEEHGDDSRAQLIRAQCELARLPAWDRRRQELTWLADDLRARHGARWRAELPALEGVAWADFERGFVSTVRVHEAEALYRHDAAIAAAAPVYRAELSRLGGANYSRPPGSVAWLRALRFRYGDSGAHPIRTLLQGVTELELLHVPQHETLEWLIACANHGALTSLKVEGDYVVGQAFARALAGAPWAGQLTRLELDTRFVDYNSGYFEDPTLGPAGARDLAGSFHLGALTALNLGRQGIGADGLSALLSARSLRGLQELALRANEISHAEHFRASDGAAVQRLDLGDNPLGTGGAAALAVAPRLAGLACLNLDICELTEEGVKALTAAPFWATLRRLDLSRNPLGESGVWALAEAKPPARLHALRLSDCDLDAAAGEVLACVPWLPGLQSLDLSRNRLGEGCVAALEQLVGGTVRDLSLARAKLGGRALRALVLLWSQLVSLDLSDNPLGGGLRMLVAGGPARALQTLRLRNCRLSLSGLEALLEAGACPSLRTLVLPGNHLETAALRSLLRSAGQGPLLDLDLACCGLRDEAARMLAAAPALAGLERLNLRHNSFGEQALVTLAQSPHLRAVPEVLLTGNPWGYAEASRRLLADRFGPDWYYRADDDEEEEPNEGEAG